MSKYTDAVVWIAYEDDPGGSDALDAEEIKGNLTVCLVADVFGRVPFNVALDVVSIRKKLIKDRGES